MRKEVKQLVDIANCCTRQDFRADFQRDLSPWSSFDSPRWNFEYSTKKGFQSKRNVIEWHSTTFAQLAKFLRISATFADGFSLDPGVARNVLAPHAKERSLRSKERRSLVINRATCYGLGERADFERSFERFSSFPEGKQLS